MNLKKYIKSEGFSQLGFASASIIFFSVLINNSIKSNPNRFSPLFSTKQEIVLTKPKSVKKDCDYTQFLQHPHSSELEEILGDDFENYLIDDYSEFLDVCDKKDLENLKRYKEDIGDSVLIHYFFEDFFPLLNKGLSYDEVKKIPSHKINYFKKLDGAQAKKRMRFGIKLENLVGNCSPYLTDDEFITFSNNKLALDFATIIGKDFSYAGLDDYNRFLLGKDKKDLEVLARFKTVTGTDFRMIFGLYGNKLLCPGLIETAEIKGTNFHRSMIDEYSILLKNGIQPSTLAKLRLVDAYDLVNFVELIPKEIMSCLTSNTKEYPINVASSNPVFGADVNKLKTHLKKWLSKKDHCYRKNTDYYEDPSQIDRVENINMLYLVKGYADYLDNNKNIETIAERLKYDIEEDHFSESGGLVVFDEDYKVIFIDTNKELNNLENNGSYHLPRWFKYVGRIGTIHFHATTNDSTEFSGPSGNAKSARKYFNGDIGCLINNNASNPYEVSCVVTKLKGRKFNADVYFRDVKECLIGKKNSLQCIVIDMGTYEY